MDLRHTLWMVAVGSSLAVGSSAQERLVAPERQLTAGARVRMSVEGSRVEGYLSGRDGDTVRLALPGENPLAPTEIAVPLSATTRVELHVGQKRHTRMGAILGAVVMGLTGFWDPVDPGPSCQEATGPACSRAEAVAIGALAGAMLGGVVGHAIKTDQWAPATKEMLPMMPPTPNEIRRAPGGSRIPVGRAIPAAVSVRF